MNFETIKIIHKIIVMVFVLIYLVKTILLLANKTNALKKFTTVFKVPEMIISTLFLATGVWMVMLLGTMQTILIIKIVLVLASIPIAVVAFKKQNKILGILSFLLIISAYGMDEMAKIPKIKHTPEGAEVIGQDLYKNNCQNCHGPKGNLGNNGATDLALSTKNHTEVMTIINNGKNLMPSYMSLSDAEKDALAAYIESLRVK